MDPAKHIDWHFSRLGSIPTCETYNINVAARRLNPQRCTAHKREAAEIPAKRPSACQLYSGDQTLLRFP